MFQRCWYVTHHLCPFVTNHFIFVWTVTLILLTMCLTLVTTPSPEIQHSLLLKYLAKSAQVPWTYFPTICSGLGRAAAKQSKHICKFHNLHIAEQYVICGPLSLSYFQPYGEGYLFGYSWKLNYFPYLLDMLYLEYRMEEACLIFKHAFTHFCRFFVLYISVLRWWTWYMITIFISSDIFVILFVMPCPEPPMGILILILIW